MSEFGNRIRRILDKASSLGAVDLHMEENKDLRMRIKNELVVFPEERITKDVFEALSHYCQWDFVKGDKRAGIDEREQWSDCLHESLARFSKKEITSLADSLLGRQVFSREGAFTMGRVRCRVHMFRAQRKLCSVVRLLYSRNMSLERDCHKDLLQHICHLREGLVIIVGPTGSGKSHTLGCCISYINQNFCKHIITLEDPVETIFKSDKSFIRQRQLGEDIQSMAEGLRDALREDPDILLIGELRDRETLEAALEAAETGHLVFATLHTQRSITAIGRMISMFPAERQEEVRNQLSLVLKAIICQRLAYIEDKVHPVRDILLNTKAVSNLIRQKKEAQIVSVQETAPHMQTFEMAVEKMAKSFGHEWELKSVVEDLDEIL